MKENRILSDEELGQIQKTVEASEVSINLWGPDAEALIPARHLVQLFGYVASLQERNTVLGIYVANAHKHSEWDQHDAWAEGFAAGHLASRLTEDDNPFEERPR